ncbi:ACL007Cp [Eremothecium gossypii ATCC 10895]|uniref:ACL007Cp n=1 Tax=Eremothecium gossypii (strain ATCC 10895 / CBS 109.51 / FGSC 9923 / NRRL Y-1056) TaxID=284811 RepID=Q75CB6_EREGS|nr:ACL007Cp [Eremothecium gossypii ATCC 10895]AAS51221.2 ACL007Cp [Eremothecium gossypii ATCC 10895]
MAAQTRPIPLRVRTWAFVSIVTIWSARRYSDAVPSACNRLLACLFLRAEKKVSSSTGVCLRLWCSCRLAVSNCPTLPSVRPSPHRPLPAQREHRLARRKRCSGDRCPGPTLPQSSLVTAAPRRYLFRAGPTSSAGGDDWQRQSLQYILDCVLIQFARSAAQLAAATAAKSQNGRRTGFRYMDRLSNSYYCFPLEKTYTW